LATGGISWPPDEEVKVAGSNQYVNATMFCHNYFDNRVSSQLSIMQNQVPTFCKNLIPEQVVVY